MKNLKNKRKFRDYILNFRFNSLFIKTLGRLCLLIMMPFCGIVSCSWILYGNIKEAEMKRQCTQATESLAIKWQQIQDECDREFSFIKFDSDIELFLYDYKRDGRFYNYQHVIKLISMPILTRSYLSNIYIINYDNGVILNKTGTIKIEDFPDNGLFEGITAAEKGICTAGSYTEKSDPSVIFWQRINEGKKNALFVMQFSVKKLLKIICFQEEGEFYIINNGKVILSDNQEMTGQTKALTEKREELKKKYVAFSQKQMPNDTEIILYMEKGNIRKDLQIIAKFIIAFIIGMFLLTLTLAVWMADKLYQPFGEILYLIRSSDSLPKEEVGFEGKDELEYILKSIEKRAYFNEDVSKEMTRRLELLKRAQAIALQSQINPHFMSNTLENINYMAVDALGKDNKVSEMIKALADMLRNSLKGTGALVTIREEIAYCEKYLKIQKIRYEDKFDVIWKVDPEVYECRIIRIVLQPLIENAVYYGIRPLSAKGLIRITVHSAGDRIQILVTDNGLGMTKEKREELNLQIRQNMIRESSHIGLSNVYQRLKLYYGDECEIDIESKPGAGTCIGIRIPKQTGQKTE